MRHRKGVHTDESLEQGRTTVGGEGGGKAANQGEHSSTQHALDTGQGARVRDYMIAADKRKTVYLLYQDGMSTREIVRRLHLSRNTVRTILKQKGEMPLGPRRDRIRIDEDLLRWLYADCKGVGRIHEKLLEEEGLKASYSTVLRRVHELGLDQGREQQRCDHVPEDVRACRKCSVVATRQWLLELSNGAYTGERFQSQLPHTPDLQFLLCQLKHGRSRHRKKAATILARKRGISNSLIAEALLSSRKTTRRYYKMYLEAGAEKLFAWKYDSLHGRGSPVFQPTKTHPRTLPS